MIFLKEYIVFGHLNVIAYAIRMLWTINLQQEAGDK